jgi:hypothetical protein
MAASTGTTPGTRSVEPDQSAKSTKRRWLLQNPVQAVDFISGFAQARAHTAAGRACYRQWMGRAMATPMCCWYLSSFEVAGYGCEQHGLWVRRVSARLARRRPRWWNEATEHWLDGAYQLRMRWSRHGFVGARRRGVVDGAGKPFCAITGTHVTCNNCWQSEQSAQ